MEWNPLEIKTDREVVPCLVARPSRKQDAPTAYIIPLRAANAVRDDEGHAYIRQLSEQLLEQGAAVVCFASMWPDLTEQSQAIRSGRDTFPETDRRIGVVVDGCIRHGLSSPGRAIIIDFSRFGFAALHATAGNPAISVAVASSPVTYWPQLFAGMEDNPILRRHELAPLAAYFPPRPMLIQIGTSDHVVSTGRCLELGNVLRSAYQAAKVEGRFALHTFDVPGHLTTGIFLDNIVGWLSSQGVLGTQSREVYHTR